MIFSALYGAVQDIAGDSNSTSRCKTWVNAAYHDILTRRVWSFLETTKDVTLANGTLEYALTGTSPLVPDFGGNISVSVNLSTTTPGSTQWHKLKMLDQQTWDAWVGHSIATSGIPAFYTMYGAGSPTSTVASIKSGGEQRLALWPVPNAALTARVRYPRTADSVELTADTDVPILPVHHHYALVLKAAALGLAEEDQAAQAALYDGLAEKRIQQMINDDERMRYMDNERGVEAPMVRTQSVAQPSPATHAPDQRPYPAPVVGG